MYYYLEVDDHGVGTIGKVHESSQTEHYIAGLAETYPDVNYFDVPPPLTDEEIQLRIEDNEGDVIMFDRVASPEPDDYKFVLTAKSGDGEYVHVGLDQADLEALFEFLYPKV